MISVVISYCSLDRRFIAATVRQALEFSSDVVVVGFDRLMNGAAEDLGQLESIARLGDRLRVLVLPYEDAHNAKYHHNLARWVGARHARHGWTLFLDADEVPEGPTMRDFLLRTAPLGLDSVSFACHWYFRRPEYQAVQVEEAGMLVRTSAITQQLTFTDSERWAFRNDTSMRCAPNATLDGRPIIHHYSWVRTREEMLAKVSGWAHKDERDWRTAVEQEFTRPFSGTDFVHGYQYREVPNQFGLEMP